MLLAGAPPANATPPAAVFAPPVMLMTGEDSLGHRRMYPSPVMFDVDGDKKLDIVIGDLSGNLTISRRLEGNLWSKSEAMKMADGKKLKFSNW